MADGVIRPVAICVIRRGSELLVFEGHDSVKGETFYRPLGGGVEFGETGAEAVARELREEIGAVLVGLRHLGTLENIFTLEGRAGHEMILVYEAAFADPRFYDRERLAAVEDGHDVVEAVWKPVAAFRDGCLILYPTGIVDLLDEPRGSRRAASNKVRAAMSIGPSAAAGTAGLEPVSVSVPRLGLTCPGVRCGRVAAYTFQVPERLRIRPGASRQQRAYLLLDESIQLYQPAWFLENPGWWYVDLVAIQETGSTSTSPTATSTSSSGRPRIPTG